MGRELERQEKHIFLLSFHFTFCGGANQPQLSQGKRGENRTGPREAMNRTWRPDQNHEGSLLNPRPSTPICDCCHNYLRHPREEDTGLLLPRNDSSACSSVTANGAQRAGCVHRPRQPRSGALEDTYWFQERGKIYWQGKALCHYPQHVRLTQSRRALI